MKDRWYAARCSAGGRDIVKLALYLSESWGVFR